MRKMKRSALAVMVGACLLSMSGGAVLAQSATGAIAGRADPGAQVTITNPATGYSRTVTAGADGTYRLAQLPVGDYRVEASGKALDANVSLGGTTTVNLSGGASGGSLDTVQVVGSRVVNRVDVHSIETATNVSREELARIPVDQTLSSVALLAPGVIGGNSSFGGISFGGSSVAENSVFINGLNVTDFYRRQSFSSAPYAFFQEFQVKTGGYSVEFGRSTGGVINAVTRSGSNDFHGGVEVTIEPAAWRSKADDHHFVDAVTQTNGSVVNNPVDYYASFDRNSFAKANVWGSGPIIRDKLFVFAMYELRDGNTWNTNTSGSSWFESQSNNGFWGAKVDWNITNDHRLELLAFSDEGESNTYVYGFNVATGNRTGLTGLSAGESGGKNGSITYTGHFGDNFVAKAMYGINRSKSISKAPVHDQLCDFVVINSSYNTAYGAMGRPPVTCHPNGSMVDHNDERKVGRLDFEWTLGDHNLRFGLDREVMTTDRRTSYPGTGVTWTVYGAAANTLLSNGSRTPAGTNSYVMGRLRADGGTFETTANAWYIEDNWNVTPDFLLNLGVRVDNFNNKTAVGSSFIKIDNLISPRLGFSWDTKGDGRHKLFGNVGRYFLPVPSIINYTFAGGLTDERSYYVLNGWAPKVNPVTGATYMAPVLGAQIGPTDTSNNISVADLRRSADRDLDAVHQDEAILGFQSVIDNAWSWGVNATYRRMANAMDDMRINYTPCGPTVDLDRNGTAVTLFPIVNPGEALTIWGDRKIGCTAEGWITIDTATSGYRKAGSGEVVGYPKPKRIYKAVEVQIDRAWDEKWAFNASYLWSKSEGNFEGPVNSDTGYSDTGMVQHWDHPATNAAYGPLFNDHRHQVKLRGTYAFNKAWSVGGTLTALSGGPITAMGVAWPNDSFAVGNFSNEGLGGGSNWICVQNCTGTYAQRVFEFSPRGGHGRMPWTYNLGANVTWSMPLGNSELKARFSVFNLLNNQEVINVRSRYEREPGVYRTTFATGTRWQSPRYAQLVVSWNF